MEECKGGLKHVLLAKFKDKVSAEEIDKLIKGYAGLVQHVEPMKSFSWLQKLLDSRSTANKLQRETMPSDNSNVLLGPWGGEDGAPWNYTAIGEITRISITSDSDAIRSISFVSGDGYGNSDTSLVFGIPTTPAEEINIDPAVEKLILMEGVVGTHDFIERVTQLSFTIRKNGVTTKYGPYGSQDKGTGFSCLVSKDQFVGFHGKSSELLNSIGLMVRNKDIAQSSWGGDAGVPWSYKAKGTISHIYVSYSDVIQAIRFTSVDACGRLEHSDTFGDLTPSLKFREVKIDVAVEKLNGITGTYGRYGDSTVIRSLAFTTNKKKTFGVFGKRIGIPFEYKVKDDEVISEFYGRSRSLINAIGVCKKPSGNCIVVGPIGSGDGSKWVYQPKGLITRIILAISAANVINSIAFESEGGQGVLNRSPFYPKSNPLPQELVEINIEGKLNGIEGTVADSTYGGTFIASLYFSTEEKIMYGPFGNPTKGTHFSFPVTHGFISGFHGSNGGHYLQSLGVYVSPI